MTERAGFGLELRRTRERCGLTLEQLAERTKISASLFAGLERGDISRWPSGIFRRAFVRSYAQAVALDPEETLGRFLSVYPDAEGDAAPLTAAGADGRAGAGGADNPLGQAKAPGSGQPGLRGGEAADEEMSEAPQLRLVLDQPLPPRASGAPRPLRRVAAPVVDVLIAGIPALLAAWLFGWAWFWVVAGAIGLVGHVLMFSLAGTTPGGWLLLAGAARPTLVADHGSAFRRRAEADAPSVPASRRRQVRQASSVRPVAANRPRRMH